MSTLAGLDRPTPVLPPGRPVPLRLYLFARSAVVMATALLGCGLFALWITLAAVSPLTLVAPLVLPATLLVRGYANAHRRSLARLLGCPVPVPYRSGRGKGVLARVVIILRDPASWRDALWTLAHSVVGFVTACLSFTLLAGAVFYLVYPFLFWVTPDPVFREPFGDWYHLQSVAQSTVVWPLAALLFTLWWVLVIPLARAEVALAARLLTPRA